MSGATVKEGLLPEETMRAIVSCAEQFGVKTMWLFGSALADPDTARDIDLAVEGLPPNDIYRFLGELMFAVSKPVDLVDLDESPPLEMIIREEGVRIYERAA